MPNANISSVHNQLQHNFPEEETVAQSDRAVGTTNLGLWTIEVRKAFSGTTKLRGF